MTDLLTPLRHCSDPAVFTGKLKEVAEAAIDVVAKQNALKLKDEHVWGLTEFPNLTVTDGAFADIAGRLDIPMRFWGRVYDRHPLLASRIHNTLAGADPRMAMFRLLQDGDEWVLRAVLSNSYGIFDNFTVLKAVVSGLARADHDLSECEVSVDLTADRLRMRIMLPSVQLLVPELLNGYRSPFSFQPGAPVHAPAEPGEVPPVLWAGVELSNSETGKGAFTIAPRAEFLICRNGLTRVSDVVRQVHLGGKLDAGRVHWSDETRRLNEELLASKVADAVTQFASVDYLQGLRDEMTEAAETPVGVDDIQQVTAAHQLSEEETRAVMDAFLRSGQPTRLGIAQAISAVAKDADESDRQAEMEAMFLPVCAG